MNNTELVVKIFASSIVAGLIDKFVLGQANIMDNVKFGASVGAGIAVGSMTAEFAEQMIESVAPSSVSSSMVFKNGKGLVQRGAEIGIGDLTASLIFTKVLKTSVPYGETYMKRFAVITGSDIIGEFIADGFAGREFSLLA